MKRSSADFKNAGGIDRRTARYRPISVTHQCPHWKIEKLKTRLPWTSSIVRHRSVVLIEFKPNAVVSRRRLWCLELRTLMTSGSFEGSRAIARTAFAHGLLEAIEGLPQNVVIITRTNWLLLFLAKPALATGGHHHFRMEMTGRRRIEVRCRSFERIPITLSPFGVSHAMQLGLLGETELTRH